MVALLEEARVSYDHDGPVRHPYDNHISDRMEGLLSTWRSRVEERDAEKAAHRNFIRENVERRSKTSVEDIVRIMESERDGPHTFGPTAISACLRAGTATREACRIRAIDAAIAGGREFAHGGVGEMVFRTEALGALKRAILASYRSRSEAIRQTALTNAQTFLQRCPRTQFLAIADWANEVVRRVYSKILDPEEQEDEEPQPIGEDEESRPKILRQQWKTKEFALIATLG